MAVVSWSWLLDILILFATLFVLLYWYTSRSFNYFKDHGIPYLKPLPFIGNTGMYTKSQHEFAITLYNSFPNERFFGFFQMMVPTLVLRDPDLIKHIMVKDFASFHDHGYPTVKNDALSKNLFNSKGLHWRVLRQKLIPTFSSGKLKNMFDQLVECGDNLVNEIEKVTVSKEAVESKPFIFNFSAEVIASTAFGLNLGRNSQTAQFIENVNKIFELSVRQTIILFMMLACPMIVNIMKLSPFPTNVTEYFTNLTKATKDYRKQNKVKRNDYFQLLLTLQENEESETSVVPTDIIEEDALINQIEFVPETSQGTIDTKLFTDEGITAQSFLFLSAGSESVSNTVSFALYQIAKNPSVQSKVKEEVKMVLAKHGSLTYQAMKDMPYLDQVIQETQRFYPVVSLMMRECTIPYTIPDTDIVIQKGAHIAIPVPGLQMDPKYYPSPEVFDPDRFENNNYRPNPTFLPFGDGPRICIAMRFAILELKVCLAKIFAQYSVEVNSKTKEPFTFDKKSFFPSPIGGIWINFKKDIQETT